MIHEITKNTILFDIDGKHITLRGELLLPQQYGDPDFAILDDSLMKWDDPLLSYTTLEEKQRILQILKEDFQEKNMFFEIRENVNCYPSIETLPEKEDIINYKKWFFSAKDLRFRNVEHVLAAHYELKGDDLTEEKIFSIDSLKYLGKWLLIEINEMKKINNFEGLFSRSFDIGIYLGYFITKNNKGAYWVQKRDKHDVDYGEVIIRSFLSFDLNVVKVAILTAQEMREGKFSENRFVELYNDWIKMLNVNENLTHSIKTTNILPESLQEKIHEMPEYSHGINKVSVLLRNGNMFCDVYIAWGKEIVKIGDSPLIPFDASNIIDVEHED